MGYYEKEEAINLYNLFNQNMSDSYLIYTLDLVNYTQTFTGDKFVKNVARTRSISLETVNELDLEKLAYRDAMWISPDNDDAYILMVVDDKFVLEKVRKKIDNISETYRDDDGFVTILKEAKIDAKNSFRSRKRMSEFENAAQTSMQSNDKINEAMLLHAIQEGK